MMARVVMPTTTPARIDSHGNPGIAGKARGVETELVLEVEVVEGVLIAEVVSTEVLTPAVVVELVEVLALALAVVLVLSVVLEDVAELLSC